MCVGEGGMERVRLCRKKIDLAIVESINQNNKAPSSVLGGQAHARDGRQHQRVQRSGYVQIVDCTRVLSMGDCAACGRDGQTQKETQRQTTKLQPKK